MKHTYISILLLALGLSASAADSKFVNIQERASLAVMFDAKTAANLNSKLDDNSFFVHAKALEYSLINGENDTVISWEGPEPVLSGKITIVKVNIITKCKEFTQHIAYKSDVFDGKGTGCEVDGKWMVH